MSICRIGQTREPLAVAFVEFKNVSGLGPPRGFVSDALRSEFMQSLDTAPGASDLFCALFLALSTSGNERTVA